VVDATTGERVNLDQPGPESGKTQSPVEWLADQARIKAAGGATAGSPAATPAAAPVAPRIATQRPEPAAIVGGPAAAQPGINPPTPRQRPERNVPVSQAEPNPDVVARIARLTNMAKRLDPGSPQIKQLAAEINQLQAQA
jgi:hypothetical protein